MHVFILLTPLCCNDASVKTFNLSSYWWNPQNVANSGYDFKRQSKNSAHSSATGVLLKRNKDFNLKPERRRCSSSCSMTCRPPMHSFCLLLGGHGDRRAGLPPPESLKTIDAFSCINLRHYEQILGTSSWTFFTNSTTRKQIKLTILLQIGSVYRQ